MPNLTDTFTQIADAIRSKTGTTDKIAYYNFPTAIKNIGTIKFGYYTPTTSSATHTIDVGFSGCKYFAMFTTEVFGYDQTNTAACLCWTANSGYALVDRYRYTYNTGYGSDGLTVTVSGNNVTINHINYSTTYLAANKKYLWIAF